MSKRRPIAALILIFGIFIYVLAAMAVHATLPVHWAVDLLFFPIAGMLWVPPAVKVFRWGQRG